MPTCETCGTAIKSHPRRIGAEYGRPGKMLGWCRGCDGWRVVVVMESDHLLRAELAEIRIRATGEHDFSGYGLRAAMLCRRGWLRASRVVLSRPLGGGKVNRSTMYELTSAGAEAIAAAFRADEQSPPLTGT